MKQIRVFISLLFIGVATLASSQQKKNVLLLLADDFNHWANCMGYNPQSLTPNIDSLAKRGVLFTNAHCASPVCNPSRNAFMSGIRPSTSGITSNPGDAMYGGYIRHKPGFEHVVTMNQFFTDSGYYAYGAGKIYHTGRMAGNEVDIENWDAIYSGYTGSNGGTLHKWESDNDDLFKWSAGEFDINNAHDTKLANHIADKITNYNSEEPFFIAAGVFRPHLPWNCHKQFWDLFNPDTLDLPVGYMENDLGDVDVLPNTMAIHNEIVGDGKWKEGIWAYLANMAYADYNIGIMLNALKNSPHAENTIVVFYGDHGWHLGEKDRWSKHTVYGLASWTTFIIYDPSAEGNGQICEKVVSQQDVYPTLIDLCGFNPYEKIEGNSLKPLLSNPVSPEWDKPIIVSYRGAHIIRTNEYSYIKHNANNAELYHTAEDPYEWTNLIYNPGHSYGNVVSDMEGILDNFLTAGENLKETYYPDTATPEPVDELMFLKNRQTENYIAFDNGFAMVADTTNAAKWMFVENGDTYFVQKDNDESKRLKLVATPSDFALTGDYGNKVWWKKSNTSNGYFSLENGSFSGSYLAVANAYLTAKTLVDASAEWMLTNGKPSGIANNKPPTKNFVVFPNPANDFVYMQINNFTSYVNISLYTEDGGLIKKQRFHVTDDVFGLSLAGLSAGNYLVHAENNGEYYVQKVVKVN